ncbi:SDR family NAD(P)-dependent oxidoreductase [Cognatiyoonia sp. IB215182]|uniref:SDR family NAD(P)-dependent oxidoreductase n=1 Tax=Cognatiyoonia sp. IB215182 TaxID=3097353 RepID=UPI002A1134F9|nr:SDR family NAD(P)-dependent oxidoreductase [Cognatiyoonia sp. IB215182]MDX8354865.1 SDR family NAD(P)-dependent oxidoreductase [Cognatiyoonia sp. IB215182]
MTKTILITGSTDGIGLLTAKTLADMGHTVILHGRSANKLKAAAEELRGDVATYQADLSSLGETAKLAEAIRANHDRIDVLINNAGVYKTTNPILPNGQDVRFVVNTLAPHVLTKALLPIIPSDGRIINLSSAAQAPVDLAALSGGKHLDDMGAYAQSKRGIALWSAQMAATHPDGPVFIAVNPGSLLASKMVKEGFGVAGHDLQIGADILCRLSLDNEFANASGRYWDNDAGGFGHVDLGQAEDVVKAITALTT